MVLDRYEEWSRKNGADSQLKYNVDRNQLCKSMVLFPLTGAAVHSRIIIVWHHLLLHLRPPQFQVHWEVLHGLYYILGLSHAQKILAGLQC